MVKLKFIRNITILFSILALILQGTIIYLGISDYNFYLEKLHGTDLFQELLEVDPKSPTKIQKIYEIIKKYHDELEFEDYNSLDLSDRNFQKELYELIEYVEYSSNLYITKDVKIKLYKEISFLFLKAYFELIPFEEIIAKMSAILRQRYILNEEEENLFKIWKNILDELEKEYKTNNKLSQNSIKNLYLITQESLEKLDTSIKLSLFRSQFLYISIFLLILTIYLLFIFLQRLQIKRIKEYISSIDNNRKELIFYMDNIRDRINNILRYNFTIQNSLHSKEFEQKELKYLEFIYFKQMIYLNLIFFKLQTFSKQNNITLISTQEVIKNTKDTFQDFSSSFEQLTSTQEQMSASFQNNLNASVSTKQMLKNQNEKFEKDFQEIIRLLDNCLVAYGCI